MAEEARRTRERPKRSRVKEERGLRQFPCSLRTHVQALLVLDPMLDAVRPDGAVPLVALEPAVLHDVGATATVAF